MIGTVCPCRINRMDERAVKRACPFARVRRERSLLRYIVKRLAYAVLTLFVLIALTFFMMRMLPGDPFVGDKAISETAMANMHAKYGLDKSPIEQFFIYIGNLSARGFGRLADL